MICQDGYVDWDDYHAEYTVEVHWVGRVLPYGEWHTVTKYSYVTREISNRIWKWD